MFATQSASNNTAVSTLSSQLEAQSSAFKRQLAANSVVLSGITDRLNDVERNLETRPDPSNRDHQHSAGAPSRPQSPTDPALRPPRHQEQKESSSHPADQTCIPKTQQSPMQRRFFQAPAVRTPAIPSVARDSVFTVPADLVWEPADRDTLLKASSRQRFTEASGFKICSFLPDAELFLTLCNRPRDRLGFFILFWLGSEKAEKDRRSHIADAVADYCTFREGLVSLFGRCELDGAYRATLRKLRQSDSESIAANAARTSDLCLRAYPNFSTEDQLSLAVDHFIAGVADVSSRKYLLRKRARRTLE